MIEKSVEMLGGTNEGTSLIGEPGWGMGDNAVEEGVGDLGDWWLRDLCIV